jgi:ring-1,2-phenylacetyl-CoA epoxidase subunit PaaE
MGLLGKIFGKSTPTSVLPKGFVSVKIKAISAITSNSVQISFQMDSLPQEFKAFLPGQYLTVLVQVGGEQLRRSYSICSTPEEGLSIGVKRVTNGRVSNYLTQELGLDDTLAISQPEGNFTLKETVGSFVFIAAGSGITPVLSMAKSIESSNGSSLLLFGNRTHDQIMFKDELDKLTKTKTTYYLSKETNENCQSGRLDFDTLKFYLKENLSVLRADGFYLCGPELMIKGAIDALKFYGVSDDKIHFELFTVPVLLKKESETMSTTFSGDCIVEIILDGMPSEITINTKKETVLEAALNYGLDAPYSCKGGVCSTCRAKVVEGSVRMNNNLTLTDKEVAQGFILTCQSHPTSERVKISYDE